MLRPVPKQEYSMIRHQQLQLVALAQGERRSGMFAVGVQ